MTKKIVVVGIITLLAAGLVYLGFNVRNLKAEVERLSGNANMPEASGRLMPIPGFTGPGSWWYPFGSKGDPYAEFERIQGRMDRLFRQMVGNGGFWEKKMPVASTYDLSTDIKDYKDKYVVNMDIPGMEKENIKVEVQNRTLMVSGERNRENEEKDANFFRQERSFGYFSQSLPLPTDADSTGISVNYKKGVLTIEIPKTAKAESSQEETTRIKVD